MQKSRDVNSSASDSAASTMLIYLASPYTHADPAVMEARARKACKIACELLKKGHHVISPIAFHHQISLCGIDGKFAFWEELDTKIISVCGELWILILPGWDISVGVKAEIDIATEQKKTIRFVDPDTLEIQPSL